MTQDELWLNKYNELILFMQKNHRNPSKHDPDERARYVNWLKHNRKLLNAGKMKDERAKLFLKLVEIGETYRRVNQYL